MMLNADISHLVLPGWNQKCTYLDGTKTVFTWMEPEEESSISQWVGSGNGSKNAARNQESPVMAQVTEASRLK